MRGMCPNCGLVDLTPGQRIWGRVVLAAAGTVFGTKALKNPLSVVVLGVLGFALGSYIDAEIRKRCPQCGAILNIVSPFLS
jgi:hypothetical protein